MNALTLRNALLAFLTHDLELSCQAATHQGTGTPGIRVWTAAGEVLVLVSEPRPAEGRPCTAAEVRELDEESGAWL